MDEGRQRPPEPATEGNGEAALGARDDGLGQYPAHRALEQGLALAVLELKLGRDGGRELDELVIEQRHPRLDRVGHAHPVHLGQDVERQVAVEIGVLQAPTASGPDPSHAARARPSRDPSPPTIAAASGVSSDEQPVAPEERDRVEIAVEVGQRHVAQ